MRTLYNNKIINHPEAAPSYTFIQAQVRVKKMRRRRFPGQPLDIEQLAVTLNEECNAIYKFTVQNSPSRETVIENQYFVEFEQARRNLKIRDGASITEQENTTIILANHVKQLNRDEYLIGFLRRAGHRNDAYVQGINWTISTGSVS